MKRGKGQGSWREIRDWGEGKDGEKEERRGGWRCYTVSSEDGEGSQTQGGWELPEAGIERKWILSQSFQKESPLADKVPLTSGKVLLMYSLILLFFLTHSP